MDSRFFKDVLDAQIIRNPTHRIETFYTTETAYYIASPVDEGSSILRRGTVTAQKPRIISASRLFESFEGFSDEAVEFVKRLDESELERLKVLGYSFVNRLEETRPEAVSAAQLADNLDRRIDKSRPNVAIAVSTEKVWNAFLLRVLLQTVSRSFQYNLEDLHDRGFFDDEETRLHRETERLFSTAADDASQVDRLADHLQKAGLFNRYEDRFFALVNRHKKGAD